LAEEEELASVASERTLRLKHSELKVKVKVRVAVRETSPHRYGKSLTIWDHTVLPATRQR